MTQHEIDDTLKLLQAGKTHYIDDYFGGEDLTFGYDEAQKQFFVHRIDTIVGSYNTKTYHTIEEITTILSKY